MKSRILQPLPRARPNSLHALPSIFSVMPRTDYVNLIPRRSAAERMGIAWERTGRQMQTVLAKVKANHDRRPVADAR